MTPKNPVITAERRFYRRPVNLTSVVLVARLSTS